MDGPWEQVGRRSPAVTVDPQGDVKSGPLALKFSRKSHLWCFPTSADTRESWFSSGKHSSRTLSVG